MQYDHVDLLLIQWQRERPDLDCSPMGVIGRLSRMSRLIDKGINKVFKSNGLTSVEFDILATLRRFDVPMTPTELYKTLMLSSGAMSTRIEHLVKREWVERIANSDDRRSCSVMLTHGGKLFIDKVVAEHVENESKILAPLTQDEREQLSKMLRIWLVSNES